MKTQIELVKVNYMYAHSHTRCYEVTISLVSKGESFYTFGDGAVCLANRIGTKYLYDKIAVA